MYILYPFHFHTNKIRPCAKLLIYNNWVFKYFPRVCIFFRQYTNVFRSTPIWTLYSPCHRTGNNEASFDRPHQHRQVLSIEFNGIFYLFLQLSFHYNNTRVDSNANFQLQLWFVLDGETLDRIQYRQCHQTDFTRMVMSVSLG